MKITLAFSEKILILTIDSFGPENDVFIYTLKERAQEVHESYANGFSCKIIFLSGKK